MSNVPPAMPGRPGTHFWVLSVDKPGIASATHSGTYNLAPDSTRESVYRDIYQAVTGSNLHLRGATVLFFSLEPNQL